MRRVTGTKRPIVASGLAALALLAACGGDADEATTEPEARVETDEASADDRDAARARARAEELERDAKFEGQARTYGNQAETTDAPPEFVSGSRRMPTR